jgi:hypothetical protein
MWTGQGRERTSTPRSRLRGPLPLRGVLVLVASTPVAAVAPASAGCVASTTGNFHLEATAQLPSGARRKPRDNRRPVSPTTPYTVEGG